MKALPIALAASLLPAVAAAGEPACAPDTCHPYAHRKFARTLVGFGAVPDPRSVNATLTAEIGGRPFSSAPPDIGAFSTGVAYSSTADLAGRFTVVGLGLFVKLDLTSLFIGGLWSADPPRNNFPFRLQVGDRLGIGASESFRRGSPTYVLLRPEVQYFLDLEIPLHEERIHSIVVRGAIDTAVNGADLFRWSVSLGLDYGWDNG